MSDERERDIHRRPAPPVPEPVIQGARDARLAEPPTQEDFAGTIGAQVVLPPDSAAAAGAKGVYPTIVENTLLRNAGYEEMGLDPQDPSGEVTDPDPEAPPGGGNGGEGGTDTAPVNRDVPHVSQSGAVLNCTMGNWDGEPTSYAYQWKIDGVDAGAGTADYAVQAGDVGKSATCVVTATNAHGSTAAPPSVGVVVA